MLLRRDSKPECPGRHPWILANSMNLNEILFIEQNLPSGFKEYTSFLCPQWQGITTLNKQKY